MTPTGRARCRYGRASPAALLALRCRSWAARAEATTGDPFAATRQKGILNECKSVLAGCCRCGTQTGVCSEEGAAECRYGEGSTGARPPVSYSRSAAGGSAAVGTSGDRRSVRYQSRRLSLASRGAILDRHLRPRCEPSAWSSTNATPFEHGPGPARRRGHRHCGEGMLLIAHSGALWPVDPPVGQSDTDVYGSAGLRGSCVSSRLRSVSTWEVPGKIDLRSDVVRRLFGTRAETSPTSTVPAPSRRAAGVCAPRAARCSHRCYPRRGPSRTPRPSPCAPRWPRPRGRRAAGPDHPRAPRSPAAARASRRASPRPPRPPAHRRNRPAARSVRRPRHRAP
ncbi:MAG: hypothetical protein AVDCRST_MAG53-1048 [uncultured Solirubrobacteraceae bacterium]|uniref:Uncharacterized protein n=1 Tax=uncultured Solirubrobacteraceae bacterium TaxID=1162706 RepID=A0A6J4S111_9ACTN|nr:MAG: hypothetical protein AVDCRST_MAG53-1048 [uncultured Solirubrobacteraceae bacterium]